MCDSDFVVRAGFGEVGNSFHLLSGNVTGNAADWLQRDRYDAITRHLMGDDILLDEMREVGIVSAASLEILCGNRPWRQIGQGEIGLESRDDIRSENEVRILADREFRLDRVAHRL